jgi:tRNA(fMet)-specific endonuclease VapC
MSYLLDTCVVSELVAAQPNGKVVSWLEKLDPETVARSS